MADGKISTVDGLEGKAAKRFEFGAVLQFLIFGALLGALYWRVLWELGLDWWNDANYSHGFLVPIFSGYLVWNERERLRALRPRGSWVGFPVLLMGIAVLILGEIGAELFTTRGSLVLILAGLVLFHLGVEIFKVLFFPLMFLFFMIPLPAIVFNAIALPLQGLAANNAAWALDLVGVPVLLDGNVMHLSHTSLGVTEACSGIRSLISLLALATAWSCITFESWTKRFILIVSAVPITILANSMRVLITGFIAHHYGVEYAEGFYHSMAGLLVFMVAFAGLLGTHGLIQVGSSVIRRRRGA